MGQRLTQKIYECSLCNNIPQDGEHLWQMGKEIWCKECCDEQERIANEDNTSPRIQYVPSFEQRKIDEALSKPFRNR